jgi:hypothetical protein
MRDGELTAAPHSDHLTTLLGQDRHIPVLRVGHGISAAEQPVQRWGERDASIIMPRQMRSAYRLPINKPSGLYKRCRQSACIQKPFWHKLRCTQIVLDRRRIASLDILQCRTHGCFHTRKIGHRYRTCPPAALMRAMMEDKRQQSGEQPASQMSTKLSLAALRSVMPLPPATTIARRPIPALATPIPERSRLAQF